MKLKLLEENRGEKLHEIGNNFLDNIPEAQATKAKMDKWDYIKLKNFYTEKETIGWPDGLVVGAQCS